MIENRETALETEEAREKRLTSMQANKGWRRGNQHVRKQRTEKRQESIKAATEKVSEQRPTNQ